MKTGWHTKLLGDVAQITAGNSAPQDESLFKDGNYPFFRTADAGRVRFGDIYVSGDYLNEKGIKGLRRYPKGTILFPKSGASTFLNHRVMLGVEGYVSSHLAAIVADETQIEPRYLLYFLSTIAAQELVQDHAYPSLNLPTISNIRIQAPPLPEQRRIVGMLDEVFTYIAAAKANSEKSLENARAIFESYLQSIFSQRQKGWSDRQLSSLCSEITVGHVGPMKTEYKESGIPFLRSQNIRPFEVSVESAMFIGTAFHKSLQKSQLRPGDVAIVRTGYPGTAAVIPPELPDSNCADLVIVRPGKEINPHFLAGFFNSAFGKRLVLGKIVGAAQKHFNIKSAKQVTLHVPPLQEQNSLVHRIENLRGETGRLESVYQRKLAALEALKQSLLHHAFAGTL